MCNIAGYVGAHEAAPILIEMIRVQEGLNGGFFTGLAAFRVSLYSFLGSNRIHSAAMADRYWVMMVAMATPVASSRNTATSTIFRPTLIRPVMPRIYIGRLVSPLERIMAAPKLYKMVAGIPRKIMRM